MLERRINKLKKVARKRLFNIVFVFEDIHDPHNALASFRNLDAFGIQEVHLIFNKEEEFDPSQLGKKTSSSANKWLTFTIWHDTQNALKSLKKQGFQIWATSLNNKAVNILDFKYELGTKIAIVFGNEHRGISKDVENLADNFLYIPMNGMVQSLNLSVSAGIVAYELARQVNHLKQNIKPLKFTKKQQALLDYWLNREIHKE